MIANWVADRAAAADQRQGPPPPARRLAADSAPRPPRTPRSCGSDERPVRRMSAIVGAAVLRPAGLHHLDPVRPGRRAARPPRQPPHPARQLRPRARRDHRRRQARRRVGAHHATTLKFERTYPHGRGLLPVTGYDSHVRRRPDRGRRGRPPHRQRRPALLPPHRRHAHRQGAGRRQPRADPQPGRAEGRLRGPGQQERRRRRARPADRRDPGAGLHPQYDPATLAGHDLDSVAERLEEAQRRPGTTRGQPRARRRPLPARLHLQGGHRRGRALATASTPRTPTCPARPGWTCR